jgi:hypothetical protein
MTIIALWCILVGHKWAYAGTMRYCARCRTKGRRM